MSLPHFKGGFSHIMIPAKISPSLMCADIFATNDIFRIFEKTGIEYLHIDIMDGHFVPNIVLGTDYCRQVRKHTNIPLDIHLMIERPEDRLDWFDIKPGEFVSVHQESTYHLHRALTKIHDCGAKAMVAINPSTPVEQLIDVIDDIDGILLMSVNPGFAGQKMIPSALDKIMRTRNWLDSMNRPDAVIEVDGNVSLENVKKMRLAGADMFVAGTAGLFMNGLVSEAKIAELRKAICAGEKNSLCNPNG